MNWQVQKWAFLLGFPCRKRVLAYSRSGLFNFGLLFAPANCLEIVWQIRDFRADCLNFWLLIYIKKVVMVYCFICGQRIHQIAFVNWLCQYSSFRNIFFNRFSAVEKCGDTPHCLYRDSLNLIYHISSNKHRTLAAPLSTRIKVSDHPKSAAPLQEASQQLKRYL